MARKCLPNVAIANEPDWDGSIFVQDNLDPNTVVFDDIDLGCGTPRPTADPTPSLEGYWDRDPVTGVLYPKVLADMVMVGKTAQSYDETFGVVGKMHSTAGYMMGGGDMMVYAEDSETMALNVTNRNSVRIHQNHMRGAQANAWYLNTLSPTNSPTTPPYSFYGDTHTGMYRHEDNGLAFSGGAANKLVLNANGTIQLPNLPATAASASVPVLARNASTGLIEQRVLAELHTHGNMTVLNGLADSGGELTYLGGLVFNSGNYYTRTVIDAAHTTLLNNINTRSLNTHNHNLADLTERSYNSLVDQPDLSDLHAHSNKPTLDRIPDYVGVGVEEGDVMERRGAGISWTDVYNPKGLQFRSGYTPATEPQGLVWWNEHDHTMNISTGLGPVLQVGQELYVLVYNNTGVDIPNGAALYPTGGFEGHPTVALANAENHVKIAGDVVIATMIIPDDTFGIATKFGQVRGIDTSMYSLGDTLWIGTTDGELTNVRPEFPNYSIQAGGVTSAAVDGEMLIEVKLTPDSTIMNFWNGCFREAHDFTVSSAGGVITGTLAPANGNTDMTMFFSDGLSIFDTSPAATIVLTAGTDEAPQHNYVYVLKSTKALTISTTGWPNTVEHVKVAHLYLRSAATTVDEDALINQNWNDHIQDASTDMGHLAHVTEKLRNFEAQWSSGTEGACVIDTGPTPDGVYFTVTGGEVYQLHRQSFSAFDTQTTDHFHIFNHFTTPLTTQQNLGLQTLDAAGGSLSNSSFAVVLWGVVNKSGEASHLMVNMPTGTYASGHPEQALSDPSNHSVYTVSSDFAGVGFLIARFIYVTSAGTNNWTLYATEDLRGKIPNTSAGGGSIGGVGVNTYLGLIDTDSTYAAHALKATRVNAGETGVEFTTGLNLDTLNEWTTDAGIIIEGSKHEDSTIIPTVTETGSVGSTSNVYGSFNSLNYYIRYGGYTSVIHASSTGDIILNAASDIVRPAITHAEDLGSSDYYWSRLYGEFLYLKNAAGNISVIYADASSNLGLNAGTGGDIVAYDSIRSGAHITDDLGGIANYWRYIYGQRHYINSATYIDYDGVGEMRFTDATSGTVVLSDLLAGGGMVYPGAGIALSTGSAWGTSITNNSANWNTAYTHSQVITGNPHAVTYAQLGGSHPAPIAHMVSHLSTGSDTIPLFSPSSAVSGLTPGASGVGASYYLDATGNWSVPAGGAAHNLLSATHSDTLTASALRGSIIVGNATPAWSRLAVGGASNHVLRSTGADAYWGSMAYTDLTGSVPTHASTHLSSGGDTISLFNTASAVSGLAPGSSGVGATYFLNATGAWSVPAGGSSVSFGTTTQIPYMNSGGTDFIYSANLSYNGTQFACPNIGTTSLSATYIGVGQAASSSYGVFSTHAGTPGYFVRNLGSTGAPSTPYAAMALELTVTGTPTYEQGPFFYFKYRNATSVYNIGAFGAMRDGHDQTGKLQFYSYWEDGIGGSDRRLRMTVGADDANSTYIELTAVNSSGDSYMKLMQSTSIVGIAGWYETNNAFQLEAATGFTNTPAVSIKPGGATIMIDSTPAATSGEGIIAADQVDDNNFGVGAALHVDTDGNYIECDANLTAKMPCSALALETGTGAGKRILLMGYLNDASYSFTVGAVVYVSGAEGGLTTTAPSASGDFVQAVGIAITTTSLYFNPDFAMVEIV